MSINETPLAPPSNLTPEQRRQAEAALLGIEAPDPADPVPTLQQIEFMRTQLAQFDARNQPREFDLNNPPRKPYHHQEYPKMLYHHEDRVTRIVKTREQEDGFIGLGYVREPFAAAAPAPPPALDAATRAEVARVDAELRRPRK